MIPKSEAFSIVEQLVLRFSEQIDSYKSGQYNETLTRRDFIDPFFKALGWDIDNSLGYAEAYREVIHEDKVKIGRATKAPDYSFRLGGGKRLFFVEAKKPSVDVKGNITVAYQIRRYGWSAKLPVSIITDFEEFAVYDCTKKPNPADKSGVARIKYLRFDKYLTEFDYLWNTFSKEQVLKGSFDRYVQKDTVKKGTATVDKEFLISLDTWRTYLATSISIKNKQLDEDEINFAVQMTIDRLIFLRIAEDRGVEAYGQLKASVNLKGDAYQNLFFNFKRADEKYNSGIFDFKKDVISENIVIDSKVIKTIINEMYYPVSPYEFSVLSVEILGSAYEQFLGKQIKIAEGHRAKIEDKPEVRKAGGVYYTPQYVVDYIVKNTVGKLIDGKTPKQIAGIKIVDPACGSGSFLIGAYQYLIDFHKNYYTGNGTKTGKKDSPVTAEGNLTSAEKKRILLNNIYGVDIDVNAVEVTKLSLLLKCLEGETETSLAQQNQLWHERILPTLDENIKSGNSLVDMDYYESVIDFGEEKKIKPFSWQKGFPEVFKQGGFDVVIGNPPYVLISPELFSAEIIEYYKKFSVSEYKGDLYHLFLEKGLTLIKNNGLLSFIIPSNWMTQLYTNKLRKHILENSKILEIVDFQYKVFEQANVFTEIIILNNSKPTTEHQIFYTQRLAEISKTDETKNANHFQLSFLKNVEATIDFRLISNEGELVTKILRYSSALNEVARATLGCQAYNSSKHSKEQIINRVFHADQKLSDEYMPELAGNDVGRYIIERKKGKWIKYGPWLHDYRTMDWLTGPRILVREITGKPPHRILSSFETETYCNYKTVLNVNPSEKTMFSMRYLCGVLNSSLISFIFPFISNKLEANTFPRVSVGDLRKLPIKNISFDNITEKRIHDEIDKYVAIIIQLNNELRLIKLSDKTEQIKSRIEFIDRKIDQLVYQLYELTEEEIKIVEGQ